MGDNNTPLVTGTYPNFDNSPLGQAASLLYGPTVAAIGRQFAFDFARSTQALVLSGNTPPPPFALEYIYPPACIELWQIIPVGYDPNNPLPTTWTVANSIVAGAQVRVIQTNVAGALAVFNNNPLPSAWDSLFTETVVRLLASKFASAIAGRVDMSESLLQSAAGFEGVAQKRPD